MTATVLPLRCLLAGLVLLAVSSPHARGAGPAPADWTSIIGAYLGGRAAEAATSLLEREPGAVTADARKALSDWRRAMREGRSADTSEVLRRIQATALLPLEVLLSIRMPATPSPRLLALERITREACDLVDEERGRAGDAASPLRAFNDWCRVGLQQALVAMARYQEFQQVAQAFNSSAATVSAAAEHHFIRGLALETQARLAEEPTVGSGSRVEAPQPRAPVIAEQLGAARRQYERTLELDPTHEEATLRLARVLIEIGRSAQGRDLLARLSAQSCSATACGLAWLFMAQAQQEAGETDAAAVSYRQAAAVPGVSRSARLALMAMLLRSGDGAGTTALLETFAVPGAAPSPHDDAWAMYLSGQRLDVDLVIRSMKASLQP